MTPDELVFDQPPIMTQRHCDAIWQCYRLFCFPGFADQQTLLEVWQHLTALLTQPVPSAPIAGYSVTVTAAPRSQVWNAIADDEPEATDQGEDPGPVDVTPTEKGSPAAILALVDKWIADPEPEPEMPPIEPLQIGHEPIPDKVTEVLQTWHPTATGVRYSATQPHREPSTPDWRRDFAPLDMTTYESDQ